jgi:hypothetical protein
MDNADENIYALLQRSYDPTLPGQSGPVAGLESREPQMPTFQTYSTLSSQHQQPIAYGRSNTNESLDNRHIEGDEDRLRDAREDLLGARYQLKNKRGELRDLRQKTGLEEGAVISQLRQAFQERNIEFPVELENAFTSVIRLRDSLGILEGNYEEEEEKYDNLEWNYTQNEEDFVARWTGGVMNIPPSPGKPVGTNGLSPPFHRPAETGEISIEFQGPQPLPADFFIDDMQQSPELRGTIWKHSKQESASTTPAKNQRRHSFSESNSSRQGVAGIYPLPRANSETGVSEARLKWTDTRKRVDTWLLDAVSCSHYQKSILRSMLAQDDLDYATWWKLVTQNWISDSPSTPPLGMDGNESIISMETIHPSIAFGAVSAVRGKADTERPEMESESHSTPDPVENLSARSTDTSVTSDSYRQLHSVVVHQQSKIPDFRKSEILSLVSLKQSEGQLEGSSSPRTIMSVETAPSDDQCCIPGPAGTLYTSSTTKTWHKERRMALRSTASDNDIPRDTVVGHLLHHIRRSSNPEPRRFIPIHHQLRRYEDAITSSLPYSPYFDRAEHTVPPDAFLSPRGYGQRPPSPPKNRSPSPRNLGLKLCKAAHQRLQHKSSRYVFVPLQCLDSKSFLGMLTFRIKIISSGK